MSGRAMTIVGWAALALLLVVAGALLLPACGLRLGPFSPTWCPAPVRVAEAEPPPRFAAEDLIARVAALERAAAERPVCAPVREAEAVVEPEPEITPRPEPDAGEPMIIPEDERDLSFLEGCWVTNSPLFNDRTRRPIVVRYCFDDTAGAGTVVVDETTESACSGPITASRSGESLTIEQGEAVCPNGRRWNRQTIACTSGADRATCEIRVTSGPVAGRVLRDVSMLRADR